MNKASISIFIIVLFGLVGNSSATSPMPIEELKPGQTAIACAIHIVYMPDREKVTSGEAYSKTFFFEVSAPKRDVLQEMTRHIDDKLDKGNVSEVKLECKFPK